MGEKGNRDLLFLPSVITIAIAFGEPQERLPRV